MGNPTWTCCAELPPCPICEDSCDFATSYQFTGFKLDFAFSVDFKGCALCTYAGGGGGAPFRYTSYSIRVTVTQIGAATLRRRGTSPPCCYEACGEFLVEWEIGDDAIYGCCAPPNQPSPTPTHLCTGSQSIIGAAMVPFNYIVYCSSPSDGCPNDNKRGNVWVHDVKLCGVQVATSRKNYVPDCPFDCGEEPAGPLWMAGMTFRWFTPLVALDDTVPRNVICGPYANAESLGLGCTLDEECAEVSTYEGFDGPFAVYSMPANCDGDDCILRPVFPNLLCQLGSAVYGTSFEYLEQAGICPDIKESMYTGNVCPCGEFTVDCPCFRADSGWRVDYPTYV